ncbi:MAG: PAS domain S-box protein [Chloroflexota bacterium]
MHQKYDTLTKTRRVVFMDEKLNILLIDDVQSQFYLIEGLLMQSLGTQFALDWVTTPDSSLKMIEKNSYDVILLDYELGQYSALDFLDTFKKHQIDIPVIVMTGHGSFDIDVSVMNAGAVDYLDKTHLSTQLLERSIRYAVEQARYLTQIQQSEQRFRAMVEKGSELIIQLDGNARITYASPSVERLLGYEEDELRGVYLTDFVHKDDYTTLATMLQNLITEHDTPPREVYRLFSDDGRYVWFEFVGTNLLHVPGIEALIINGRDVSEQRERLRMEQQHRLTAEALLDTSIALNSTLDFDAVIARILENIGTVIPHQSANVMLIDDNDNTQVKAHKGYDDTSLPSADFSFDVHTTKTFARMLATQQPIIIHNIADNPLWVSQGKIEQSGSYLGTPIVDGDNVIGFINIENAEPNQFTQAHIEYIKLFAELSSIAITNAQQYDQASHIASLEERQRLARELHDAVSQTLFSASVIADALTRETNNALKMHLGLEQLAQLNRSALAEMRSLLVELRPQAIINTPLSNLIENLCDSLRGRSELTITLEMNDFNVILDPKIQLNLYRIVQEILNNIDKHAQAHTVNIELRARNSQIEIIVADDGIGYDADAIPAGHHGVSILRERAERIGADLVIDTELGEGTYIHLTLPKQVTT